MSNYSDFAGQHELVLIPIDAKRIEKERRLMFLTPCNQKITGLKNFSDHKVGCKKCQEWISSKKTVVRHEVREERTIPVRCKSKI